MDKNFEFFAAYNCCKFHKDSNSKKYLAEQWIIMMCEFIKKCSWCLFISEDVIIGTMLTLEAYEKSSMGTQTDFERCDISSLFFQVPILAS